MWLEAKGSYVFKKLIWGLNYHSLEEVEWKKWLDFQMILTDTNLCNFEHMAWTWSYLDVISVIVRLIENPNISFV